MELIDKIVTLHHALDEQQIPHAFGGALALAWCTQQARGTIDIDINIFLSRDAIDQILASLPPGVTYTEPDLTQLRREGQARFRWGAVPVDLFLNTSTFHNELVHRIEFEDFADQRIPFLSCTDLAIFKAFFNRPKDWVDLAEMIEMDTVDSGRVLGELVLHLDVHDPRIDRFKKLARPDDAH
jgi:hypothetical protein